jgi:hypothetical protein
VADPRWSSTYPGRSLHHFYRRDRAAGELRLPVAAKSCPAANKALLLAAGRRELYLRHRELMLNDSVSVHRHPPAVRGPSR